MSSYRLADSYCVRVPRRAVYFAMGGSLLAIAAASIVLLWQEDVDVWAALFSILVLIPLLLGTAAVVSGWSYFRRRRILRSFELILERDELTRRMIGLPDLTLFRDEVTDLVETVGAGTMVHTATPARFIFVPAVLVGYEELRGALAGWHEITVRPSQAHSYWLRLTALLALIGGAYAVVLISASPYVAVPAAALLFGVVFWCLWSIQRSPQLDAGTKRRAWMVLLTLIPALGKLAWLLGLLESR